MDLQLINTLCESRIFRNKANLNKYSDSEVSELYYAVLLATIGLALDTKTNTWAQKYAASAAAFANFDYFRISANDLYILTYIVMNQINKVSPQQKPQILRLYKGIGKGSIDVGFAQQILLRLERSLGITNTKLRTARRTLTNWGQSSPVARRTALSQIRRIVYLRSRLAEVIPYLDLLVRGEKGGFGKSSALKTAAAIAGAGLAGIALGLRHDPNKKISIMRNSVEDERPPVNEDRATQLFQLVQDMKKHPEIENVVEVNYLADGISAFVRTTDGNAYEMQIRPARYAKGHHKVRGLREGWDWCILGEDVVDFGAAKKEKEHKEFWDKAYALHPEWKESDEYEAWFDTLSDEEQDAELAKQTAIYDEQDRKAKEYIEQFRPIIDKIVEFMDSTGADLVGDFRTLTKQRKRGKQYVDPKLIAKLSSVLDNEILQKRIRVMDEYSTPLKQLIDYDESMPLQINSLGQYIDDDGYDVEHFWDLLPVMQKNKTYLLKNR
jgi:hypothetical protein